MCTGLDVLNDTIQDEEKEYNRKLLTMINKNEKYQTANHNNNIQVSATLQCFALMILILLLSLLSSGSVWLAFMISSVFIYATMEYVHICFDNDLNTVQSIKHFP